MQRKLWQICLAVWFLCYALLALTNLQVVAQGVVMGLLALAVAVLLFLDR